MLTLVPTIFDPEKAHKFGLAERPSMLPRRKQIIERAAAVVYRKGYGATTVSDVLSAAAVGKGNFYHYFEGKDDLGVAIVDALAEDVGGVPLDEVFSAQKEPLRRLADYLELVRAARRADQSGDPLCTLASELGSTPPFAEHIRTVMIGLRERLEALITEVAIEKHATVDNSMLARMLLATIHGLCVQYKVDGDGTAFDTAMTAIPRLLDNAISGPTGRADVPSGHARAAGM